MGKLSLEVEAFAVNFPSASQGAPRETTAEDCSGLPLGVEVTSLTNSLQSRGGHAAVPVVLKDSAECVLASVDVWFTDLGIGPVYSPASLNFGKPSKKVFGICPGSFKRRRVGFA